jgi:hypothetical protein
MTIEEIKTIVNSKKTVTRQDILSVLNIYDDYLNEKDNVINFLESLDEGIITIEGIDKILNDLPSYKVKYKRDE